MNTAHIGKTLHHAVDNIVNVFKEGADLATNNSDLTYDEWNQHVRDVFHDTGTDSAEEARSEAKEHLTKHLMDKGMSRDAAEKWFEAKWKDAIDNAENIRTEGSKISTKIAWFVGATASVFIGALGFSAFHDYTVAQQDKGALNLIRETEMQQDSIRHLGEISISADDFNIMIGALSVPSAPTPVIQDTPPTAAAVLPAPVAAEAAQPVDVEVTTPSGTQTITTTIEQVYRNSPPPVQQRIVQDAPPIDHGYNHENPNDCFHTHCLGGLGGEHKIFTVDGTPFGSATFSY